MTRSRNEGTGVIHYQETDYGFEWGAATVVRISSAHKRGWVVLGIHSPKSKVTVYVTKTGKIRLFKDGVEV